MPRVPYFNPAFPSDRFSSLKRKRESVDEYGSTHEANLAVTSSASKSERHTPGQSRQAFVNPDHPETTSYNQSQAGASFPIATKPLRSPKSLNVRHSNPTLKGPSSGLRQQHFTALNTLLHRSILEGDFQRARRTWAILLRLDFNGHSLDLRNGGRWGLGAEMCFRSYDSVEIPNSQVSKENIGEQQAIGKSSLPFDVAPFTNVQEYYARLALQYPYRKIAPSAISALHLYYTLFGIWIGYIVDQRDMTGEAFASYAGLGGGERDVDVNLKQPDISFTRTKSQVQDFAERLDDLMSSPPISNSPSFWNLKGMVTLWIADLSTQGT
ncbi:uncharacterized protein KY384_003233 [Bacidia gigantensis]|uniref:uncharacterized protein n=1 Tax=Bacidia gigantensis TaxID=2732470 RepID=UPI001D03FB2B|nr:uncharacterized protein KY384_003233 [Bacidia gigantensis]KAG8531603.1 hypothetical protein KY384_003233 [Bacidia gigantensis]